MNKHDMSNDETEIETWRREEEGRVKGLPPEGREFLDELTFSVKTWSGIARKNYAEYGDPEELLTGFLHSVLCVIDGVTSGELGPIDLVIDGGKVINGNEMLHEHLYRR